MGNEVFNDFHPYQYQVFKTEPKPGESSILVRPDSIQGLSKKNLIDRYTQIDCLEYYLEKIPNDDFLGTREYDPKEKKYGKYIWKSRTQIYHLAKLFLYGITKFNLCPEISVDDEILGKGKKMRFMGIYSQNREEWIICSFGCQMDSITIVTLYDTLGMNSIEFIFKQTELTTILAESKNLEKILKMKEENKLGNVKNIIYLNCNEEVENLEDIIKKLKNSGLNLISYETIISTGKKCLEEKNDKIINKNYKKVSPDDIFLICYTSGTMDNPKGAMITARSATLATNVVYTIGFHFTTEDKMLSFLPLAHIMEQMLFTISGANAFHNKFGIW